MAERDEHEIFYYKQTVKFTKFIQTILQEIIFFNIVT